jgi:hypothetical protein
VPKKDDQPELPAKVDDWKAPWEVDKDGNDIPADDQDIDAPRLKKYLHGLLGDKQRLRTQVNELTEARTDLEQQIADASDPKKIEELQKKVTELQAARDADKSGAGLENAKLRVALRHGLTEKQAARLVGTTEEELEADAEELVAEFGTKQQEVDPTDAEDDPDGPPEPRRVPRRVANAGDPDRKTQRRTSDGPLVDPDKFAEEYARRKGLGYN